MPFLEYITKFIFGVGQLIQSLKYLVLSRRGGSPFAVAHFIYCALANAALLCEFGLGDTLVDKHIF